MKQEEMIFPPVLLSGRSMADQVSRESAHSAPLTHLSADKRPHNNPHSNSDQPRFSRPYFSAIRINEGFP